MCQLLGGTVFGGFWCMEEEDLIEQMEEEFEEELEN